MNNRESLGYGMLASAVCSGAIAIILIFCTTYINKNYKNSNNIEQSVIMERIERCEYSGTTIFCDLKIITKQ